MNTPPITAPSELCSSTARAWKERVARDIAPQVTETSVDLSKTRFIDSSGLGALLSLHKTLRSQGGILKLLNPSAAVTQLIELTRLHRVFEITHA
jgi:anti-sigma B factor antagonist